MAQDRPTMAELLAAITDFLREEAWLLGRDGTLEELNRARAQQLRTGQRDERDPALMAHLDATIADKIAIANPKWR